MERFEALEDRVHDLTERMNQTERNYRNLRDTQNNMREAQIRLETYVRESFRRSEEQDGRQLDAIKRLDTRYEEMEKLSQKRQDDLIQRINEGVQDSLKAVGNSNPVWVTGTLAVVTAGLGILIGAAITLAVGLH